MDRARFSVCNLARSLPWPQRLCHREAGGGGAEGTTWNRWLPGEGTGPRGVRGGLSEEVASE